MAGASYEVGSAWVQILPSFDGILTAIGAEAEKWGDTAGSVFAQTFKSIVNAELKDMDAVKIDADTSEAMAKAQALRAEIGTLDAMIDLGLDETDTQEKLAALQAELATLELEHPEIRVGVDTGEAELGLGELTAEVAVADTALGGLGGDGAATEGLDAAGASASEAGSEISGMTAGIAALAVALVPIGGLALGAFAAIPALIAGAITGVGALYAGLEPIITTLEAFSASKKPTATAGGGSSSASTALSNATAERDAAYSVQQAEEALTNAQVNGAQAVTAAQKQAAAATVTANQNVINSEQALVNAERAVTEAVYNEQQAQEAVIAARTAAANQLQDYTDQLADNAISQQQDQLNLTEAQSAYSQATQPGSTATYDQQQQAYINLEQAQQAITDLNDQNSQLQATASAAFAAGVDGAQGVLDAEHNLQTATQNVTDAIQAQQTAQQNVATATTAAAQQIITNEQNISNAQKKNAQGVSDAEKSLEQALANQKDAFQRASIPVAGASAAVNTYKSDFDKLTPAGQNFVDFVEKTLLPAFTGISGIAQQGLLPGVQKGLEDALPLFKDLGDFIGVAATGIGDFVEDLGKFAGSTTGLSQIQQLFQNGLTFMGDLGQAAEIFLGAFVGVGAQSKPIIDALGNGIVNIAKAFLNWVNDGGFQGFLTWLQKNGPALVSDVSDFLKALGKWLVYITPLGEALDTAVGFVSQLVSWAIDAYNWFNTWASSLGPVGSIIQLLVEGPIYYLIAGFKQIVAGLTSLSGDWQAVWADIKNWADDAWQFIDKHLFQPIGDFFTKTIPSTFDTFIGFIKALPGRAVTALGDFASLVWGKIEIGASWLDTHVWQPIESFFTGLPGKIATAAEHMWDGIEAAFVTVFNDVLEIWNNFHLAIPAIRVLGVTLFGGFTLDTPNIPLIPVPKYHTGGVVQGTPGIETLAYLMPGETVIPRGANLSSLPTAGGQGLTVNLTMNGIDFADAPTVRTMVRDEITGAFDQFSTRLLAQRLP